jgi:hypothetical protein
MRVKVYSQLEKLWKKHGPLEFGKICQIFLGLCLINMNFKIQIFQLSGRPDIVAISNKKQFAFEVKTQSDSIATIKKEDLEGVIEFPEKAIVAVLSFPDLECSWILSKANEIRAGKLPIAILRQHSDLILEKDVNDIFPEIVDDYFTKAELGTGVLYDEFNLIRDFHKK